MTPLQEGYATWAFLSISGSLISYLIGMQTAKNEVRNKSVARMRITLIIPIVMFCYMFLPVPTSIAEYLFPTYYNQKGILALLFTLGFLSNLHGGEFILALFILVPSLAVGVYLAGDIAQMGYKRKMKKLMNM